MADTDFIIGARDAEVLKNQGFLGPGHSVGSRRIHKRRLNRSSDEEYHGISLEVHLDSPDAADAFATIPIALISQDTLTYLGFSTARANEIWTEWTQWPATGPRREVDPDDGGLQVTFLDFITAPLESYEDVHEENDDQWRQCLIACGICEPVQDAIMDPTFKYIRSTNSCLFWVKDTLCMRYAGLEDIRRASRQREMEFNRASSRPGESGSGIGQGGERGGTAQQNDFPMHENSSHGQRSVSGIQQQTTPGISRECWNSDTAKEARVKPGHIVLFKGMDQGRIAGLFNENGEVQSLEKLLSLPPSDFSGTRSLFYFTPDYNVAEYYAAYAKRRARYESVVMVCLTIPQEAIDNLEEPDILRLYWPTPQWKQLVWRSKTTKSIPKPLRKYREALLIIGTISKGATRMYENIQTWEDMTEACVLRVGVSTSQGNPAVQYVFSGEEEGREFIHDYGKVDMFPFSEAELQALLRRYA